MKFKKNDLVRLRQDLEVFDIHDCYVIVPEIYELRGQTLRIRDVVNDLSYSLYGYSDALGFVDSMFEDAVIEEEMTCSQCGKHGLENVVFGKYGQVFCEDCAKDVYVQCDCCGNSIDKFNDKIVNVDGKQLCEHCLNEKYALCVFDGKYHLKSDLIQLDNGKYALEELAIENGYKRCDLCGKWQKNLTNIDGELMCDNCLEHKVGDVISGYHSFRSWQEHRTATGDVLENNLIGFELEVEVPSDAKVTREVAAYVTKKKGDGLFVIERDGSLSNGFEIISHPMTMDYVRKIAIDKLEDACNYLVGRGVKSHNTSTCGLHFHVNRGDLSTPNRSSDEVIDNILLIMETFKKELQNFSRRNSNRYCKFLIDSNKPIYMKTIKKVKDYSCDERYFALNLTNEKTIEFRIFKGTLKYKTFLASMELVNNIVNIAKYSAINGLTWEDIINYNSDVNEYIVEYNDGRGIESVTKCEVLSPIEQNRENYSLENLLNDKFGILLNYSDSIKMAELVGVLLANGIKYSDSFNSLIHYIRYHYDRENTIHIVKNGNNYRLRQLRGSCESVVELSDLIDLWNEYEDLLKID